MTTTVVYANATTDGYVLSESGVDYSYDGTYDAAVSGASDLFEAAVGAGASLIYVGQNNWEADYNWLWDVWQAFLSFDTSAVGTDTISAAVLTTTEQSSLGSEDIRARLYDWGTSLTTGDWVGYASLSGHTLLAHSALLGWTIGATNDWTDDALAANVNKTGTTRMIIHSASNQAYNTTSTYGAFRGPYYTGTTTDPKITITHAAGSTSPTWTTPADAIPMSDTPALTFTMPTVSSPMFFNMQIDSSNAFNTGDLRDLDSSSSQTGWEFWNGSSWTAVSGSGVPSSYSGNEARYTVQAALSNTTWYRRVRSRT